MSRIKIFIFKRLGGLVSLVQTWKVVEQFLILISVVFEALRDFTESLATDFTQPFSLGAI